MPRFEKEVMLKELESEFEVNPFIFFSSIGGLKVKDVTELRRSLTPKVKRAVVVKHTLAKKVLKKRGLENSSEKLLKNSVLFTFGAKDPQDISKLLVDFLKGHEKFVLNGAIIDGAVVDAGTIKDLAKMPSRQVLLGQAVSGMYAPVSRLVLTLGGLIRTFVADLNQVTEKKKS